MGLLDDAIKQHLELKRKHGAPEEEVQRQQEEALGPVRRDAAEQPESAEAGIEAADGDEVGAVEEEAAEPAVEEIPAETVVDQTPAEPTAADASAEFSEADAAAEPAAADTPAEPDELFFEEDEAPFSAVEGSEAQVSDPGVTQEYDPFAEEEHADEAEQPPAGRDEGSATGETDEGGDLLEDTPDFLQETPEHDRLWFEQKPPRDFDFD
jgi:hypothetical protein